jgi:inner membrane protein
MRFKDLRLKKQKMLARTHLAFSFLAALWLRPMINTNNVFIFFGLFLLGSILPDIDNEHSLINSKIPILPKIWTIFIKHRGIFHSIYFAFLIPGLVWFFINKQYGIALFLGYTSHLIMDGFTKAGINLLHPFSRLKIEGPIETGKVMEHVLLAGLIFGSIMMIV